jgi:hypothetical protein
MTRPGAVVWLIAISIAVAACPRGRSTPATAGPIQFSIDASRVQGAPFYVMVNGDSDQPGWVTVIGSGGRAFFRERCDIADCGVPPVVCGAGIPVIQNIGPGATSRSITTAWDKTTSVIDNVLQCERRQPAAPGPYVARFCYSREAEMADGKPTALLKPTCVERPFTLDDRQVTLTP